MPLYTLNDTFERDTMVEGFVSLIWTERYSSYGDFEIITPSTAAARAQLQAETWLGYSDSDRVMKIRTIEDYTDDEGRKLLKVTGPSIEKIMLERVGWHTASSGGGEWILNGTPGEIARYIFEHICIDGFLSVNDIIPLASMGGFYPADTVPESTVAVNIDVKLGTVYDQIKSIVDQFELGFRLIKHPNGGALYFNVYSGNDRTSMQSATPAVVFSPELDNLSNVNELSSVEDYRNIAYVFAPWGSTTVQAADAETIINGFDRRVLLVEVTDEPEFTGTPAEILAQGQAYLTLRGREALYKQKKMQAFDGEISQNGRYKYNADYILGDLVEMRNSDKVTKLMRVTEQIFVEDAEGKRSYPTLTDVLFITPGSWMSWDYGMEWATAPDTLYWANA